MAPWFHRWAGTRTARVPGPDRAGHPSRNTRNSPSWKCPKPRFEVVAFEPLGSDRLRGPSMPVRQSAPAPALDPLGAARWMVAAATFIGVCPADPASQNSAGTVTLPPDG